ncbi:esterase-like activity of phytase family protein [Actinomadura rayongensis]|uniref:Esterase-like activity of phytase family protein n=1 Tax=Actinomadura rayongensis TaxID=1429076 RepID=A0A6I4WH21_9ACTN|nr:esterase-like activity of phytase family protein [Actinomadura rayongensis]MXQ67126.1 esterase-like activity of phytase family protein [Actinomadura rayongensis]
MRRVTAAAVAVAVSAAGLAAVTPRADAAQAPRITRFLGERRLPHLTKFRNTTVGGFSGVDRDPRTGTWYLISDDRWRYEPARFYTATFPIDRRTGRLGAVTLTGVHTLAKPEGGPYPGFGKPRSVDPESIRFDPVTRRLVWGNEGDRPDATHDVPLAPASVQFADVRGRYAGALTLPANARLTAAEQGPRRNAGFEGVAVTKHAISAMLEGPRYEDGAPPSPEHGASARLTVWDRSGRVRAQYAYPIDRLPARPVPADGQSDSGVSEILPIDGHRYLALERSWIEGVGYRTKLYAFDVRGASNVLARTSLRDRAPYRPVSKRLVADLTNVSKPAQNLESLAWGPRLATGECTLIAGSDDNFDKGEVTQFLGFALRGACPA